MKKLILITICFAAFLLSKAQQTVSYAEYFDYYYGYCPGDPQYDNWVNFRAGLDTNSSKFLKITMKGTYDMQGKTCSDKYAVRQIADALYYGYDASILCGNDWWYVGTGCSDYNCGNYSDYVELTTNQYGTCNCGTSYTIRPGITSPNWGGINTETCQWGTQNANQIMIAEMLRIDQNNNLAVTEFIQPDECINTQDLQVKVMNVGFGQVSNYYIGYTINGVAQTPVYITDPISSEEEFVVTFATGYTFSPGVTYDFEVWTYDPNGSADDNTDNDLIAFSFKHAGSPAIPTASNVKSCGNDSIDLYAVSGNDSIVWYDASTGGNMLKVGNNYRTKILATTTFYAEANAFKSSISVLSTTFHNYTMLSYNPYAFNGNMFDIKASKLIHISGLKVQALFNNTSPFYRVYIKDGTFVGNERNPSKWKLIYNDYLLTSGDNMNTIPLDFIPEPGKTYGIYVTTDPVSGEDIWANYGNNVYSNSDLTMTGGKYIYGLFASSQLIANYTVDAEILYSTACVSSSRKAVVASVNPKPNGSELVKGSPFDGKFDLGLTYQPDVAEINKTLTYELTKPTLYTNAGYGTTWQINSVQILSKYGVPVDPSLFSFTDPSASSNGILTFTPDNSIIDSSVSILINYKDLGPYDCDTTVKRVIHIAPTPKPDFGFDAVLCDGSDVIFANKSSIHSGEMSYKWYFDDGDSSDSEAPIHLFKTFGSFDVKLVARSIPWGILYDTTIVVNIIEVPKAKFKPVNACEGTQVRFINESTISSGTITYDWDFGDNSATSNATDPTHSYPAPSAYSVTLTASSGGCQHVVKRNAYLFAIPVADFTVPATPVCSKSEFVLPNNSTILQGAMGALWQFDDGEISTQLTGKHSYTTVNTHTVKLTMVSEFGCTDSITKSLIIKPSPTVDFSADKLCSLDPSTFTNLSTEFPGISSTYTWSFSDGTAYATKNVIKTWDLIGQKTVTLRSDLSNGCSGELSRVIDVLIQPKADFKFQDVCSGEKVDFVNNSSVSQGDIDYTWDFGDATPTSALYNPTHTYSAPTTTTFMVSLITKVVGGCDDTARKLINVTQIPNCNFTFSGYYLPGNLGYKFTPANNTYSSYEWYFGEGGSSTQTSPIYQYHHKGSFKVKLVATNSAGCSCEGIQTIDASPSGLSDISVGNVLVYPNPANNQLTVEVDESLLGSSMVIYNSIGQVIEEQIVSGASTFINTENYANGFYTVKLTRNGNTYNFKVIVNH